MKVPNVLLSTTRSWNCGDDFIAFGVRRLLQSLIPRFNPLAYNRNPDLHTQRVSHHEIALPELSGRPGGKLDLSNYVGSLFWRSDNSWRPVHGLRDLDLVVFAGTPEWFGDRVEPLVMELANQQCEIPIIYLGMGGFEGRDEMRIEHLSENDQKTLKKAALITVRDNQAEKLLAPVNARLLACPALFCSPNERERTKVRRIALSTQPIQSRQPSLNRGTWQYSIELFGALAKKWDCEVVCHYHDEISPLQELGIPVRFSYDPRDYFDIYDEYDLTITTRVHGAGICASMGIPAFALKHSARSGTVDGFLAEGIDMASETPEDIIARIESFDVAKRSGEIIHHKHEMFETYRKLLRPIMDKHELTNTSDTRQKIQ